MYYLIRETLTQVTRDEMKSSGEQYVAVLTSDLWETEKESFDMGIDIEPDTAELHTTKVEVNYDSLTGSFFIPDREDLCAASDRFAFALDEKGVVFIDDSGAAERIIGEIRRTKKWRMPSLERFLYDFLEQIVRRDRELLERFERELDGMETAVLDDSGVAIPERLNEVRSELRDLRIHYEQLLDFGQELEENENNFFKPDNLRFFRLFSNRIARLRDTAASVGDHAVQIRDVYKSHLDVKQNRIMTVLTVVTTIFMPLTLIAGWYGMNFRYMPELESEWGYPVVIAVSAVIVLGSLWFFKKKKWL